MKCEILAKGNALLNEINQLKEVATCFEYRTVSLRPSLIIEYDGDGRETIKIPGFIGDTMIQMIKDYISERVIRAQAEFDSL